MGFSNLFLLLFLQVTLSSLKGAFYLLVIDQPILRAMWRQFFMSILYLPVVGMELKNFKQLDQSVNYKSHIFQFFMSFLAQAIFVGSLSYSINHTHISNSLLFYNSSVLIYCWYKLLSGQKVSQYEIIGVLISTICLIFILQDQSKRNQQQQDVSSMERIFLGDFMAFAGSIAALIYAYYYYQFESYYPQYTLTFITRFASGLLLLLATLLFENSNFTTGEGGLFRCIEPNIFVYTLLNALLSGILVRFLQKRIQTELDTLTYRMAQFFEPLLGTLFAYIFSEESFPQMTTMLCMLIFILALLAIQKGRIHSETDEFQLETMKPTYELQQLEMMFSSQRGDEFISQAQNYRYNSIRRRTTKIERDMNMEN